MTVNIDIGKFLKRFNENYNLLYENKISSYDEDEAIVFFDDFMMMGKNKKFIKEFCEYRGDYITSDREAAAFGLTMFEIESL